MTGEGAESVGPIQRGGSFPKSSLSPSFYLSEDQSCVQIMELLVYLGPKVPTAYKTCRAQLTIQKMLNPVADISVTWILAIYKETLKRLFSYKMQW